MNDNKRVLYYDLLNIAACVCVVALHCNQMVHTWSHGKNWAVALLIEVIFYWAVPIFFMLTGATLMRYRERYDDRTFLMKRISKTGIPFLAWSIIWYLVISIGINGQSLGFRQMINAILNNEVEQVYWFFFPLFSVYLAMPVLSRLANHKHLLLYMAGLSFIFTSLLPFVLPVLGISWPGTISMPACGGMLMFVIIGYLLSETNLSKRTRYFFYVAGIASLIFRYAYTYLSSYALGTLDRTYFNYSAFPSVLLAMAVFILFKQLNTTKLYKYAKHISLLSSCSFGVYLIHKPILDRVFLNLLHIPMTSPALRTIGVVILYTMCVMMVLLMKKIPFIQRIVP